MKKIIRYFPLIVICYALLWPFTIPSTATFGVQVTRFEQLPVFHILGFNLRALEVVFFILLFSFYIFLLTRSSSRNTGLSKKGVLSNTVLVASFLIAWTILGFINGNTRIPGDLRIISYALFVPLFFSAITSEQELLRVFRAIFVALVLLAIVNAATSFFPTYAKIGKISRLSTTMSILLFCLAISYYIHYRKNTTTYFIAGALASIPAVTTLSKWGIAALLGAFLISPLFAYRNYKRKVISLYFMSVYVVLFTVVLFNVFPLADTLAKTAGYDSFDQYINIRVFHADSAEEADLSGDRLNRWAYSMERVKESPVFGKGLGFTSSYEHEAIGLETILMEHNIIIWLLLRTGLVGTFAFIYALFRFLGFSLRVYRREEDLEKRAVLNSVIIYICISIILNLIALRLSNFEEAVIFWFSVFTVFFLHKKQKEESRSPSA